jgi:SAM-dependent methyltransferase
LPDLKLTDAEIEGRARAWTGDKRSAARLRAHYEIERELADRLRRASATQRATVYGEVYDELFRRVPDHPQLTNVGSGRRTEIVGTEMAVLAQIILPEDTVLEIGAGDCQLSRELATRVRAVDAVDVSQEIAKISDAPANLRVHVTDGIAMPVPSRSVTLAYSNQLMEHLHPDDVRAQLREIAAALAEGGRYVVITPNGLTGPWDVSRLFSTVPSGFHLHEYSNRELSALLREGGLGRIRAFVSVRGRVVTFPAGLITAAERLLLSLPRAWRDGLLRLAIVSAPLRTVRLIATRT